MAEFSVHRVSNIKITSDDYPDRNYASNSFKVVRVTVTDEADQEYEMKFFSKNMDLEISHG